MFKYILKRVLIFIPTLIAISLLTFMISVNAPGDPVAIMLNQTGGDGQLADKIAGEKAYLDMREKLGLDLPVFYFSLGSLASPDTLYRIPKRFHRETLENLVSLYGNWPKIETYYKSIKALETGAFKETNQDVAQDIIYIKERVNNLYLEYKHDFVQRYIDEIENKISDNPQLASLSAPANVLKSNYSAVVNDATAWKNYVPAFRFYPKNQYHRWLFGDGNWITGKGAQNTRGIIRGDFGISYQDKRPINDVLSERIKWTMLLSLISIILTYLIAVPIGVYSAVNKGSMVDNAFTTGLFILYSLPSFWVATLLIFFFGGGDYFEWFPAYGIGDVPDGASLWEAIQIRGYHFILPLFCWTYGSFAFLSRQMRGGMLSVVGQDYIRTAYAKGLEKRKVIWKHAFRNSLLPVITLFANVFPLMIGGSVVLEVIFTIPGMGKWGYDAIIFRDYPVVFAVMMLSAVLTMVGYLVADILYAAVDPRISFSNKK